MQALALSVLSYLTEAVLGYSSLTYSFKTNGKEPLECFKVWLPILEKKKSFVGQLSAS